jgi:hypothetical protein
MTYAKYLFQKSSESNCLIYESGFQKAATVVQAYRPLVEASMDTQLKMNG